MGRRGTISGPQLLALPTKGLDSCWVPFRVEWLRVDPRNLEAEPGMMACPQGLGHTSWLSPPCCVTSATLFVSLNQSPRQLGI